LRLRDASENFSIVSLSVRRLSLLGITNLSPRVVPEGGRNLEDVRRAVQDLHALRREMAQRKGFKPLSDKEIKDSINECRL
jgi:hypothetical protein